MILRKEKEVREMKKTFINNVAVVTTEEETAVVLTAEEMKLVIDTVNPFITGSIMFEGLCGKNVVDTTLEYDFAVTAESLRSLKPVELKPVDKCRYTEENTTLSLGKRIEAMIGIETEDDYWNTTLPIEDSEEVYADLLAAVKDAMQKAGQVTDAEKMPEICKDNLKLSLQMIDEQRIKVIKIYEKGSLVSSIRGQKNTYRVTEYPADGERRQGILEPEEAKEYFRITYDKNKYVFNIETTDGIKKVFA